MATIAPTSPLQTLTTGLSSFIGGYGTGVAKTDPTSLATTALAGNKQAYNNAFQSSFNYLAQSGLQASQQRFQAQQAQLATDRAFQLQDRRDLANVNELSMRQTGRPEVGIGTPGSPDYIPGWKDQYDNYVSSTEGPPQAYPQWKQQEVASMQKQMMDARAAQEGMAWGVPPDMQEYNDKLDREIADFQANPPPGYSQDMQQKHIGVLNSRRAQPRYYKTGPTPTQQLQQSVAPIQGPNGQIVGYATDKNVRMNFLPKSSAGGGGSSEPMSKTNSVMDDITGGISLEAAKRNMNAAQAAAAANLSPVPDRPGAFFKYNPKTGAVEIDTTLEDADLKKQELEVKRQESIDRKRESYAKEYRESVKSNFKEPTQAEMMRRAEDPGKFADREIADSYKYADERIRREMGGQQQSSGVDQAKVNALREVANSPNATPEQREKARAILEKHGLN